VIKIVKQRISLKDLDISINGKIIGGAITCTLTITREGQEVAYEGGSYMPVEIVDGKVAITGEIQRAWIDVDLLNELFPNQALLPSFDLAGQLTSGKTPIRDFHVMGCKPDSINVSDLGLDGFAKNNIPFKALNWRLG